MIDRTSYKKMMAKDSRIVELFKEHNLSSLDIDNNFNLLLAYLLRKEKCVGCNSLEKCPMNEQGYMPVLNYNGVCFTIDYSPCDMLAFILKKQQLDNNLTLLSCSFENFDLDNVYVNNLRKNAQAKIKQCISSYLSGTNTKGLYLYGKYGCGKTYLLAFLSKKLADEGKKVIFAYYPDLVRTLKSSIGDGSLESIVDRLKTTDVLVLDDFGGEVVSNFIRDEVLGSILQERMLYNRLTFMSSNIEPNKIRDHLKESSKDIDEVKASRIYERIRVLMDFVELNDKNYRD